MRRLCTVLPVAGLAMAALAWGSAPAGPATSTAPAPEVKVLANPFFVFDNGLRGVKEPAKVIKDLGYAGMGASGIKVKPLVDAYRKEGLKVFSTYVGCQIDKTPAYGADWKDAIKELKGSDVVLWLTVGGGKPGQEDDKAAGVVREIADLAAEAELKVALYPHAGFYVATARDAIRLVKKVDRKNVGVTINLCHELMAGNMDELPRIIEEAAPNLFMVSVNGADKRDKTQTMGWDRLIRPLGQGDYDVYGFLKKLRSAGYTGPIGLQCYAVKGDAVENLTTSIRTWKDYSARLAAEGPAR
jgi:sugar phosphate isomerase/epimerase